MDKKSPRAWWEPGVRLFAQISGWIVFPILIAVYGGRWLDQRFQTAPKLFILSVAIAFVITNIGIVALGRKAMKNLPDETEKNEN